MARSTQAPKVGPSKPASAAAVAGRLRLLQAELADEAADARQQLLAEEIDRALRGMAPSQRLEFLTELEAMFPTWSSRVDPAPLPAASIRTASDERELKDPAFLTSRLVDLAPALSETAKQAVIARLKEAGLSSSSNGQLPAAGVKSLSDQLKLENGVEIDAARLLDLATMLSQFAMSLDQPFWRMWKEIAPRSTLRRTGDLSRTIGRFAVADDDVPRGQVQQELESLRKLVAALIQAVGQAGKQFAQGFRKYSPAEIEALAKIDKKWTEKLEEACWRKYRELSAQLDESTIEDTIRQNIATYAESFLGNRR